MGEQGIEGMLSPYRVLDLTDEKGLLCGKLLGDLGADVIKVERPGGDPARDIGPFYHDEPDPEKSLFWFAFNTSKKGITLNIETADGQDILRRLVKSADFVIESFPPGYMDSLGLGYSILESVHPEVVMVSITPFGQAGPYRDYKAPDIVAWAMGGEMFPFGDADRPPVRISHHSQSYLHAGLEAAVGAMIALFYRQLTGKGQHVDVSIQESVARRAHYVSGMWDMERIVWPHGAGVTLAYVPNIPQTAEDRPRRTGLWPCKDGYVTWVYWFGPQAKRDNPKSIRWMESMGMDDPFLREFDASQVTWAEITPELIDRIHEPVNELFMKHTKAELLRGALANGVWLYPVSTPQDILEDAHQVHLEARGFWTRVEHPELGTSLTYPGAFGRMTETPLQVTRRAPLIGEHNREVYQDELGIPTRELTRLRQSGVV